MRFSWIIPILATSFLVLVACQASEPAAAPTLPHASVQLASQPTSLATTVAQAPAPTRTAAAPTSPTQTRPPSPTSVQALTSPAEPKTTTTPQIVFVPAIALPANQTNASLGGVRFSAELANTPALRTTGLSRKPSLPLQTGMLFIFENGLASNFWMKEMQFPLDFVWIGADCTVVDITEDVPIPKSPSSPLPLYASRQPAAFNFEINGGQAKELGLATGDYVRFNNIDVQGAHC